MRRPGCRSEAVCRSRRRRYRSVLPSFIVVNVRSLPNKMDELTALTRHQRDYRECSIMVLTETWLTALTPDTDANLDSFQLWRADRTAEMACLLPHSHLYLPLHCFHVADYPHILHSAPLLHSVPLLSPGDK